METSETKRQIRKAIEAHGLWKLQLLDAVLTGKNDLTPESVIRDDACVFGQWLLAPSLPPQLVMSHQYEVVRYLHARFHFEAAKVLATAMVGADMASELLSPLSRYTRASSELRRSMMKWEKSLR
ncbi:MAG: CZB domain-containing protein [Myxococcales bacterium]